MEEGEQRKKQKQKQERNDAVSGKMKKKNKAREDGNGSQTKEVTEHEVEEFFAILKRIHVAVSYFKRGNNGDGRQLIEKGSVLRQTIEGDFAFAEAVNGVMDKQRDEGAEDVVGGFDLNAYPDPE